MSLFHRDDDEDVVHTFVNPWVELNAGLWSLFAGATVFLGLRLWCKITRRFGLWYDDYILIVSWIVLLVTDSIIIHEFATGYVLENSEQSWDDRMHILINISSCGVLIGQAITKTAFAVTLLRLSNRWQRWFLWFCIVTMNSYMFVKVIFQWAKVCGKKSYDNYYRFNFCIGSSFRDDFKEGGNIYNIIMDFIFAAFPWLITRSLEMRKVEKIGLCATMSLGMVVAIVSAIRVGWKDEGNDRDAYYIYRNGLSQVWYNSEITGTIIVQCIPVLRTLLREIHTTFTADKLGSSTADMDGKGSSIMSKISSLKRKSGRSSIGSNTFGVDNNDFAVVSNKSAPRENIPLKKIQEEEDSESGADPWGGPSPRSTRTLQPIRTPRIPQSPRPYPDVEQALGAAVSPSSYHSRSASGSAMWTSPSPGSGGWDDAMEHKALPPIPPDKR